MTETSVQDQSFSSEVNSPALPRNKAKFQANNFNLEVYKDHESSDSTDSECQLSDSDDVDKIQIEGIDSEETKIRTHSDLRDESGTPKNKNTRSDASQESSSETQGRSNKKLTPIRKPTRKIDLSILMINE
jgi:hypothetical protein